jgi:hypothetical protein
MNDYEKTLELFKAFKLNPIRGVGEITKRGHPKAVKTLLLREGDSRVVGYGDFFVELIFTTDGEFLRVRVAE